VLIGVRTEEGCAMLVSPHDVLHSNVQSIRKNEIELDFFLIEAKKYYFVMFTEHWVKADYLKLIHVDQYNLVSHFSREMCNHGGSLCICSKRYLD